MGFNYYQFGNVHPCGISNHQVYYTLPSGLKISHETSLDVEIPEQLNLFISNTVAFMLFHEDKMYIGRYDSSISIYRVSDELLVGLNTWNPPRYVETRACGFYNYDGFIKELHLDLRDKRTVYIGDLYIQGVLEKPLVDEIDMDLSFFSAKVIGTRHDYSSYKKGGESVEVNIWTVQEGIRSRDCRIFL